MSTHTSRRLRPVFALLALALAAVVLTGCSQQVSAPAGQVPNTVTASGSGTIQAAPDEATMSFGITNQSKDSKKLLADTSKAAQKIVAALKKAGVADKDIQTQNVSVYPQTSYMGGKATITGYEAGISVNVKVRDLTRLGDIITAGNDAGANNINGPSFVISEDSPFTAKAIDKAVAAARRSAEAMAKAADKSVGEVLSISDSTVSPVMPFAQERGYATAGAADSVEINPGQLDVNSNVVVVFELK